MGGNRRQIRRNPGIDRFAALLLCFPFGSAPRTDPSDDVADIVGDPQGSLPIEFDTDRAAEGIASFAEESGQHVDGRPAADEGYEGHLVATVRSAVHSMKGNAGKRTERPYAFC